MILLIFLSHPYSYVLQLCFQKDDVVVVTQSPDGGWWEGTLGDKTGWFPANYVTEIAESGASSRLSTHPHPNPKFTHTERLLRVRSKSPALTRKKELTIAPMNKEAYRATVSPIEFVFELKLGLKKLIASY